MYSTPYFLGLDASTQALKASLLSADLDVIKEVAINFDADLPHYKTKGGVLLGPEGSGEVFSPVLMVVEAMDLLFEKIKSAGWEVDKVRGVAAAGQQHASVYWSQSASEILSTINPSNPLLPQFTSAFSRQTIPNWQDSSTTSQCRLIEEKLGGPQAVARLTGSKAHERFTGPQIMRFLQTEPEAYAATSRISLVSSFITTLLCLDGEVKGIDESDACGMNLWAMEGSRGWCEEVLEVVVGDGKEGVEGLKKRLGEVEVDGGKVVGNIGRWFVERYGFNPECAVFPGTGDNPATFLSLTLQQSEGLISLGTSDVVLVSTNYYNPSPEYHAFFHPAQIAPPAQQATNGHANGHHESLRYFNMLVYKNGSLTREHVRNEYFNKSWDAFNQAVEDLRPKSKEDLPENAAFWWLLPDIIPDGAYGVHKFNSPRTPTSNALMDAAGANLVKSFPDTRLEAISLLSSQLLNYRSRSSAILDDGHLPSNPSTPAITSSLPRLKRVYATGGASANHTILSLMADVLNANVCKNVEYSPEAGWVDAKWNACSVGVAYKARWGWERIQGRKDVGFDEVVGECRERRGKTRGKDGKGVELELEGIRVVASPGEGSRAYERSVEWWRALEDRALEKDDDEE